MDEELISTHKLLVHSNEYKKTNALNVIFIFMLFAASLGIQFFMEHLKNNGMEFADKSLPDMIYYLMPGLSIIFGLLLIIAPFSILRGFYIDSIEIRQYGIRITGIRKNDLKFIPYDKFTLSPVIDKEDGRNGFALDIKKVTLKRHFYFYSDFENPQEMEENLKKLAYWR